MLTLHSPDPPAAVGRGAKFAKFGYNKSISEKKIIIKRKLQRYIIKYNQIVGIPPNYSLAVSRKDLLQILSNKPPQRTGGYAGR